MRRLIYYALAFVFLVSLVIIITWQIGYIHGLRELAVVAGLAAVGVATVMALFVAILERQSSPSEQPPPKEVALAEKRSPRQIARGSRIAQAGRGGISIAGNKNIIYATQPLRTPLQRPSRAEHFSGREKELADLLDDLQPGNVITLTGPGGIGKTALAAEAIWTLAPGDDPPERFPDGILFHSFYNRPQADLALEKIALAYGEEPRPRPKDAARRALAGRRALLVLDGAENADGLSSILEVRDHCCVLITSRSRRDAPAERQDMRPLPLAQGVRLLQAWAGERAQATDATKQIYQMVGGLPLALRLVGRYLDETEENAEEYMTWLEHTPLEALDQGERRQESLPLLVERSLGQVSEASRQVLSLVGLLALAPFGEEETIAGLNLPDRETKRALGELVNYGLLLRHDKDYEIAHVLIHVYMRNRHPAATESLKKIAAHYIAVARAESQRWAEGFIRLDDKRDHMINVIRECAKRGEWKCVLQFAWALYEYLTLSCYWTELLEMLNTGLSSARALNDRREEGLFLGNLGNAYFFEGQFRQAAEYYEQALVIAREVGDRWHEGWWLGNLGNIYRDLEGATEAIEYYEQALAIAREVGYRKEEGVWLGNLGATYHNLEKVDQAIEYYEQALEIAREIRDREHEGLWLGNLGAAYHSLEKTDQAIEHLEKALIMTREVGDRLNEGLWLSNLGYIYHDLGQVERAVEYYERALEIAREIGNRRGEGIDLGNLGLAYTDLEQVERSIEYHQRALGISREIGDRGGEAIALGNLGEAYGNLGRVERAIEYYEQALKIFIEIQSPYAEQVRPNLAELKARGDTLGNQKEL
jgi:tetratricopeptide (TPR) repeat protein